MGKDIFITAHFRSTEEHRALNLAVEQALLDAGYSVYLPQRDTDQEAEWPVKYDQNETSISAAKLVLAIAFEPRTENWGYEVGYARGIGKPVLVLASREGVSLMTGEGASHVLCVEDLHDVASYQDELLEWVRRLIA